MVKWKKISKRLLMVLTAAMMLIGSQVTAFAYVDQGTETTEATSETEQTDETVLEDEHTDDGGSSFSVPGNAEILDDISDDSSKEFLTVTTKNNNTFYIVIDRSATSENVYMLSQIDENDLEGFLSEDTQEETAEPSVVIEDNHTEEETTEAVVTEPVVEEESKTGVNAGLLSILVVAGVGIGAYYYFKIYKNKQDEDDSPDEGLEIDDGLETINEDEEAEKEKKTESNE